MPFYDLNRATTSNGSAGTETTHMWGKTVANQETVSIMSAYASGRFGTAGGSILRIKANTGTVASGGTAQTPQPKNSRLPAAASTWFNDATTITAGTTLLVRMSVGFAQTGGQGGFVPVVAGDALQMMANSVNPVDVELTSIASAASVTFDLTLGILEGSA
jgi:hypothetical protein